MTTKPLRQKHTMDATQDRLEIEAQAAQWLVRINAPDVSDADIVALTEWLEASDAHVTAFDTAERIWQQTEEMSPPAADIIDIGAYAARPKTRSLPSRWPVWSAAGLAAATIAALILVGLPKPATLYETQKGEQRAITLADGTRLHLNSATRLAVRLQSKARRLTLEDGEVALEVVHDPKRPLSLAAGDQTITDIGTEFVVLRHGGDLRVTVREGEVAMNSVSAPAASRTTLQAGQQATHTEGHDGVTVTSVDTKAAYLWQTGRAIYRDQPLSEVVSDLNRYMKKPLVLDAQSAQLKVTAVLKLESDAAIVNALEAFLPVDAQELPDRIELHYRK